MNPETAGAEKKGGIGGLLLTACIFIGLGAAFDFMPEGLLFGLGAGFLALALWRYLSK